MISRLSNLACAFILLCFAGGSGATTIWDETTDGDLSGDPGAPSVLVFGLGSNKISGSVFSAEDVRDYVTFNIAEGHVLTRIDLVYFIEVGFPDDGSEALHAINIGATSYTPGVDPDGSFLGTGPFTLMPTGTDLLQTFGIGPLGAGDYSYLIQQSGSRMTGYSLDFVIVNVPLPPALWLFGTALLGLVGLRRSD